MQDFENAPYRVTKSSIVGTYNVMGQLSAKYPILIFQGTKREAQCVAALFNAEARKQR